MYPRWRHDGREFYYVDPAYRIIAVDVKADDHFQLGKSTPLFRPPWPAAATTPVQGPAYIYDVTPDGQHFLVSTTLGMASASIKVELNWLSTIALAASRVYYQ